MEGSGMKHCHAMYTTPETYSTGHIDTRLHLNWTDKLANQPNALSYTCLCAGHTHVSFNKYS